MTEVPQLLEKIFRGGVDENIRPEVWISSSRRICFSFRVALVIFSFILHSYRCGSSSLVTISGINRQRSHILNYTIQTRRDAKYSILNLCTFRKQLIKMDGHKWSRTSQVRETNRRARVDEYFRMKLQWKSMSEEQQNKWVQKKVTVLSWLSSYRINQSMQIEIFPFFYRFSGFRERKTQIEKDIGRTDRSLSPQN